MIKFKYHHFGTSNELMEINTDHQQLLAPQKDKQADFISVIKEDSTTAFEVVLAPHP